MNMIKRKNLIKANELPKWLEYIQEWLPEGAMKVDGFDDCICGIVERFGMERVLLYNTNKIIEKMVEEDCITYFEVVILEYRL